jgi:hypothetical protein
MPNARQRAKNRAAKAAAQAAATSGQQTAQAQAVGPCPQPTPAEIEAARVAQEYDKIARNGHAVQRHGEAITPQQLADRALAGVDPASGTTNDAYAKDRRGRPRPHRFSKHATKWKSKEALVKADEAIRKSDDFKNAVADANRVGDDTVVVNSVKLQDALGADYKDKVAGVTRVGPPPPPRRTQSNPTDFTDGKIRAVYKKDAAGNWKVETMFPDPVT